MPATHMLKNKYQKLVQIILSKELARVSVNLIQVFFWYKFLACSIEHSYIPAQKLSGT